MVKSSTIEEETADIDQDAPMAHQEAHTDAPMAHTIKEVPAAHPGTSHTAKQIVRPKEVSMSSSQYHSPEQKSNPIKHIHSDKETYAYSDNEHHKSSSSKCDSSDITSTHIQDSSNERSNIAKEQIRPNVESKPLSVSKPPTSIASSVPTIVSSQRSKPSIPELVAQQILAATFSQVSTKTQKTGTPTKTNIPQPPQSKTNPQQSQKDHHETAIKQPFADSDFHPIVVNIEPESDSNSSENNGDNSWSSTTPANLTRNRKSSSRDVTSFAHAYRRMRRARDQNNMATVAPPEVEAMAERLVDDAMVTALEHVTRYGSGKAFMFCL